MTRILMVLAAPLITLAGSAYAQDYPQPGKTISIIVPSTAGGGTDTAARIAAPLLEEELGVPVNVVNRPGASMQIGHTAGAKAKPDGYTLTWAVLPTAASLYLDNERKSGFKRESLKPVALYYGAPFGVAVKADSPYKSVADVVKAAQIKPGTLRGGTTGYMSTGHFANIAFQMGTKVDMATVNFQGGGPEVTALLGGHIDVAFNSIGELLTHHKAGTIRILAVMDERRSELAPDVPTLMEAGFKVEPIGSNIGLAAPAETPQPIIDRLSAAMQTVTQNADLRKRMLQLGNSVTYLNAADYTKHWDGVDARFAPLIQEAKKQSQ